MSFKDRSTSTSGKLEEMLRFLELSKKAPAESKYFSIGLVGASDGLERHIEEHRAVGISEENIIFVEKDHDTYQELFEASQKIGFKGTVIEGDFLEIFKERLDGGLRFWYIDFDGVECYSDYTDEIVDLSTHYNVINIHLVTTTRGMKSFMRNLEGKYKHLKSCIRRGRRYIMGVRQKDLIEKHLQDSAGGYSLEINPYIGRPNSAMLSIVLIKKTLEIDELTTVPKDKRQGTEIRITAKGEKAEYSAPSGTPINNLDDLEKLIISMRGRGVEIEKIKIGKVIYRKAR